MENLLSLAHNPAVFPFLIVFLVVVVLTHLAKAALGIYAPHFRHSEAAKKLWLPLLATSIGLATSWFVHPPTLHGPEAALWGLVVGFFSTAIYRFAISLIEKKTGIKVKLDSSLPPRGNK